MYAPCNIYSPRVQGGFDHTNARLKRRTSQINHLLLCRTASMSDAAVNGSSADAVATAPAVGAAAASIIASPGCSGPANGKLVPVVPGRQSQPSPSLSWSLSSSARPRLLQSGSLTTPGSCSPSSGAAWRRTLLRTRFTVCLSNSVVSTACQVSTSSVACAIHSSRSCVEAATRPLATSAHTSL